MPRKSKAREPIHVSRQMARFGPADSRQINHLRQLDTPGTGLCAPELSKSGLSERQHALVDTLVQSGRYQNASEVLREGLRLIEERDRIEQAKLKALRQAARQGWTDVSAGRYTDVADDQLDDFVGQLGRRAVRQPKTAG